MQKITMEMSIAFIGAVGVPNNYGGFEMFLESCAPELVKNFKKVLITCDRTRYKNRDEEWHGVRRVFIPVSANGPQSVLHDLLAFFAVFWRVQAIIVLGVSGGIFFPLFRLLCAVSGKKLIVNVDGIEWRRAKFSRTRRWFLYLSDRMAQQCAHQVVVDNEALRPFLICAVQKTAVLIAYPGDHVRRAVAQGKRGAREIHCLTICRIEPENNCHVLIDAFGRAGQGRYIFIGNWDASDYGRDLKVRYAHVAGLEMRAPVYDKNILASLREHCTHYLHGHSVGGTNPSLVEMLFYDCAILAFDCAFNRCTADDAIQYFTDEDALAAQISDLASRMHRDRTAVRLQYTQENICGAYTKLIEETVRPQRDRERTNRIRPLPDEMLHLPKDSARRFD